MQFIEDLYPTQILDLIKYRSNKLARQECERFLKESKNVCHDTWNIHKKLYEERFGTVYCVPARGGGKLRDTEQFFELLESGRDVKVMTSKDISKSQLTKPITLRGILEDKDLFFPEPWRQELDDQINEAIYKEFAKHIAKEYEAKMYIDTVNPYDWKPIVRPDTYIFHGDYVYPHYMSNALLVNVVKDSILEVIDSMKGESDDST